MVTSEAIFIINSIYGLVFAGSKKLFFKINFDISLLKMCFTGVGPLGKTGLFDKGKRGTSTLDAYCVNQTAVE